MEVKKVFKQLLDERHTSYEELAEKLGMQGQSLRNKISRGNYSLSDFMEILELLDCDLQVVTKDTGKVFY